MRLNRAGACGRSHLLTAAKERLCAVRVVADVGVAPLATEPQRGKMAGPHTDQQAPAPIEFRHQQTSRVLIAPNSRSAPPVEETGLDFRGGDVAADDPQYHRDQARLSAARSSGPASPPKAHNVPIVSVSPTDGWKRGTDFNEPQSGDFPTLPQLLTSLVGGLFWLGLSLSPLWW